MIDIMSGLLLASAYPQETGLMHSKQAGRYEIVKELPKESSSFDEMFDYADAKGTVRTGYVYNNFKDNDTSALAIGGTFGFDTAAYKNFSLHVNATVSQNISAVNDDDIAHEFFDVSGESFIYLSQANVNYTGENFDVMAGRILIDTPYADSDDIRMAANTFEGLHVNYTFSDALSFSSCYLTRWAGFDSGEDQNEFKDLVDGGFGLLGASVNYKYDEENLASLWLYYVDGMSSIAYGEYAGHYNISNDFHIEYAFQASNMMELDSSSVNGTVIGAMTILDYGKLFGGLAFNRAFIDEGDVITNGFGGGSYYTSLDEMTLGGVSENAVGEDVMAYRIGVGYRFDITGLVVEGVFGNLKSRENTVNIKESDLIVTYNINERWSVEGTLMSYNSDHNDEDFDRGLFRIDYNF